ncbi:MAG: DNA polymerase I [SAR324 cluster bacterium]|uniref:DNA polymerase I n=1 Tax=SAR324 cluster bacterium TaxID=2024889 RepID=A0A7X9FSG8_9DELT|nr:DNA polymerase I [SAR324 cluster bacterium]
MTKKIFLVDGSGYIFRAYYAVQPLSTRDGFPTNALYGFTRMLVRLVQEAGADYLCVVFDSGRETFRTQVYKEYKANRDECPADLGKQMPYFREIVKSLGLPLYEMPGYEADDIIGTLVKKLKRAEHEVTIVSGDKDLMQLVDDKVEMWDTMRDKRYGPKEVREKFGVSPEQMVEFLALTGDSSDNVPGLSGVGPKTAAELLSHFQTIEDIIVDPGKIEEIPGIRSRQKIAKMVRENVDTLRLSRKLVELCLDAPLLVPVGDSQKLVTELSDDELIDAMLRREPDRGHMLELAERFEFASLVESFRGVSGGGSATKNSGREYSVVYADNFDEFCRLFSEVKSFAFDTETTSLDVKEATLVSMSFAWMPNKAYYIPFRHEKVPLGKAQVKFEDFVKKCGKKFLDKAILKCAHNFKYDFGILSEAGLEIEENTFDTMIAAYLLNPDRRNYSLESLAKDYLHRRPTSYLELVDEAESIAAVDVDAASHYAGDDALDCWELKNILERALEENELNKVFEEIEMPLIPVLSRMERRGVRLDVELLDKMSKKFNEEIETLRAKLYGLAGCEFNVNSPKQIGEILFDTLRIPTQGVKKTKSGYSTDQSVLENLSRRYEFPRVLLQYRMLFKLKSTYIDALPAQVSRKTGRLHSSFHQTGTATGRLSSSDPNLQNIPIQSKEGREIRKAFIAEKGNLLISADYSQIELRVLAHMSNDEAFIKAFHDGQDIHAATTREILGLSNDDEVTAELRRIGKTINFGIVYGMGAFRLARELGIPLGEAQRYIDNYFARYPGIKKLFSQYEEEAVQEGFVRTLFGRKRVISEIDSSGRGRGFSNRAAMNAPIQGTAADLVKAAMIRIDNRIQREDLPLSLVLQIHDELLFECEKSAAGDMSLMIRQEMEQVAQLNVPLKVEIGIGDNWDSAHS